MTPSRTRPAIALALLALAATLLAACAGTLETPPPPAFTPAPAASDAAASDLTSQLPVSPAAGIITKIESEGLDKVRGFTLQTDSGEVITFVLGTLDNGDEFPPGHLKEHQATADPVLVFFKDEDGKLVVYHLEDAG